MNAKQFQKYAESPADFRDDLRVDVDGNIRRFGDVMDPWQRDDFAAMDPGLMRSNGRSESTDAKMRAYLERPRGHSKTTDIAVTCCWALAFATRPIRGHVFAADQDQAALLKNAMHTVIRLNPWIGTILEVQKNAVVNIANGHPGCGGTLEIYSSSVATSYGILSDLLVTDELTHQEGDGSLWHSIISSAAKRSNCLLFVISNAGFVDSWQWQVRESARTDDAWHFSRLDGPQASWLTPQRLAEQRRMLPAVAYSRLWDNNWSTGGGDALTTEVINRAFIDGLQPMNGSEEGWRFVCGVDLGLVRDCSAVVVLAVPEGGRAGKIRLAHHKLWRPTLGKKLDFLEIERYILELDEQFVLEFVSIDTWNAEHLAQSLEADTDHWRRNQRRIYDSQPWVRATPPTPTCLREQATLVIECFNDRRLQLFDCEPLRRDFHKLRVEEKPSGIRLTSPRDGEGHGDSYSAFGLAILLAHEVAGNQPFIVGGSGNMFSGDGQDYSAAFRQRQREYAEEQEAAKRNDDPSGFKAAWASGNFTILGDQ